MREWKRASQQLRRSRTIGKEEDDIKENPKIQIRSWELWHGALGTEMNKWAWFHAQLFPFLFPELFRPVDCYEAG